MSQFDYFIFCLHEAYWPIRVDEELLPANMIGDEL